MALVVRAPVVEGCLSEERNVFKVLAGSPSTCFPRAVSRRIQAPH